MNSDSAIENPDHVFTRIWFNSNNRWFAVKEFRKVGLLGMPYSAQAISHDYEQFVHDMAFGVDYSSIFRDEEARTRFKNDIPKTVRKLSSTSMSHFHSILDAASLVFAHSIIDAVSLDYIHLCSLISPHDFVSFIKDKKVTVSSLHEKSKYHLIAEKVSDYVTSLDRESLLKKIDILFTICKPQPGYRPMSDYEYDRQRLQDLDQRRQDYVHKSGPIKTLPQGDADLFFLEMTTYFLMMLVHSRYKLKIDPEYPVSSS